MLRDFGFGHGEGRAVHLALVVLEAHEQLGRSSSKIHQVAGVSWSHVWGESDQGRPVVDGMDFSDGSLGQVEDIAVVDGDALGFESFEGTDVGDAWGEAEFGEELFDCGLAQFDADDVVALRREPSDIECLAAQGDEDSGFGLKAERVEVGGQDGVGMVVVEGDFAVLPAVVPKFWVHRGTRDGSGGCRTRVILEEPGDATPGLCRC